MRPTGKLHLGHLLGALKNWASLQDKYQCIFSIADWHALMSEYENSKELRGFGIDMAIDWLACGIDPQKSILYLQSDVPEHLELQMFLSCLTPLGWLERNPTYKEQLREITSRDLQTYAFLGYPVLQAADILLYKADAVPIGEDQLPHLELCREIARRFNSLYKPVLIEPDALLTETPKILGTDRRKMSKSYGNAIYLSDSPETTVKTVQKMITDPLKIKKNDPGRPEICNVFTYHTIFSGKDEIQQIDRDCRSGALGCVDCKNWMARNLNAYLGPIRTKRTELEKQPKKLDEILSEGSARAQTVARKTLDQIKDAMKI